jgi:hypothetical protein
MDTQRGQVREGRFKRQRASLLQQGEPRETGFESPRSQPKDRERRSTAKVLLRQNVWDEVQVDEFKDSQRPEQPYKQEP